MARPPLHKAMIRDSVTTTDLERLLIGVIIKGPLNIVMTV